MEEVTASYSDVFKGLGCMEGALHLEVDMTVAPAIMPPCRMPLTLKNRLKDELIRLEKASVVRDLKIQDGSEDDGRSEVVLP